MDKKKNRGDPLAAGRQKLQQFRQKKADKKDPKGSTSQGKSSKKSGKSDKHEPKPDTSAVREEVEAPPNVAAGGGATSRLNIGEEVADPPQTSVNAAAHDDGSVDASSSQLDTLQPGNTTVTSDSGAELRKVVVTSESDISIPLSTEEENVKSIDIGAAGTVDSLASDLADTEKGATHDDASISVDGIVAAPENLAEGQGVEVESGPGNVEMQHSRSSLPESIPDDASLICARGDQVKVEDDGSHKEQFPELSATPDIDSIANEERQKSFPAIVDSSVPPSHFSEGSSVAFDSAELEGKTSEFRSQHIGEAAKLNEEKPEASIGFRDNRDHVLLTERKESSIADVSSQLQMPESVSISGVLSHEEPCKKDTLNPSGEVSAALVDEGRSVSFLQLMDMVRGLGQDEFQALCNAREAASSTGPGTTSLERLREELFISSTMEDILHVQVTEQSHLQNEFVHQHNQLEAELSQLRASYNAVKERNDSLEEELSECQSNLHAATSSNEKLKDQLLATEAQVENFTSKINELQLSLEKSLLDLSEANEKFINLHVENDTLVAIISSWNDEKKELHEEKKSKNYEIKHLSSELCNCKNSAAILKAEVERLEKTVGPLTDEKINLVEEKYNLLGEAEKLKEELANCKTLVTLQEVENSNIRETLSLLEGQKTKLKEHNLHLTEENEKAHIELSAFLISETYLLSEYSNLKEGYSLLNNKLLKFQEEKEHLVEDNDKLTHELFILQERMSPVQEERIRLAAELGEAMARLDKLTEESTSLSSSIQVEKAGIVDISNEDASELINQEIPETSGRRLEVGVTSKQSVPFVEHTCQSPGTQQTTLEEVTDASSGFFSLNENLEKGEKMIQSLEEAIKQILSDSSLRKSSKKADTPAVSKLIHAFESKGQQEEHESEKGQLTGDQSDVFVSVNVQISNLRGLLEQLVLNAGKAGIQFNELKDDRTATNQRLEELNVEFASHQNHINLLEADAIENKISLEVLKNCSCEMQHKNHELELLCESLKLRNDSIGLKNTELNKKLSSCLSRIYELENQLESLQNNLNSMLSSMEEQLVGLQDESLKAMMLEQELTSSISQFSVEVVRLDDCLLRYGTAGAISIDNHMSNSVDMAVKVIDDLEEKLEVANAKHESSSNKYEELKHSFNTLLEKNGKVYADLTKLITESCGSVEMAKFKGENPVVSDPSNDGNCENLMEAVRNILSERLELQSMIDQLQSDLLSKTNDMEELTQRSLDPTSLRDLVEKVEGVLELESGEISFESPALYVEFLISQLVQKFIEAEDLANLIRNQLEAKENELMEIQESLLHHKTEMDGLRENISQAEESLVALRSELQEKSNELEQSEQRLLSTREKLSIAVAKGKGLIVNRDNVKQLLAQTSAELQRCSEELSLKDTRLQEVEAKLKTYTEAGERVEALESELSYIRNSATALRESFLLKDSLLHRIEEILEDLDLPEQFHTRDILDKVEWLARSANGNSLRPSDWDQKSSDGGAGYVPSETWREEGQTGTSSEDDLRIKFDELQGKFYGLAEQNEMLEQSLMHRNNLVQRWEALLGNIDMPPQLKSMEVENKIEWVASTISEARHDKDTLQRKIDNLEVYCQSLSTDLEVSQKQVCDVEANLRSVDNERVNLSERLETLNVDHDNLSARAIHLEVENEKLQNQVKDLHGELVEKLGNEEQFQTIKGDLLSLRYMINDVIEEDGLQDLALASNSENLDVLLRKLIDFYKNLVKSSLPREGDDSFCETRPSNADARSGESLGTHEATSHGHHPENIVEATSRDITVIESPDVASLTKDLDEALRVQKLVREERDLYMEKQQSLVAENAALDKKIIELQEFLKQEEQKSASAREKLNVAVRKGKALVQQRDSLKQTIEEMNAEHGRLKSEIINRDEMLLENENKFRELESYTVRVEALESECQLLKNHLQETENILQERSDTLSMTLNALNGINIGDEGDRYDPLLKLQRISQLFQNMSTAVSSAEQESIKSRRAAELLLAELNEVQERNDSMQEELSKLTYEIEQLSRQKDTAEAAKVEAISRCENLSRVNNEEKKKLYAQVMSFGTNVNTLRKILAGTNICLADIFTMNMEFLHHLKANMESCATQTGTNLTGWPQVSTMKFVDKEIFSRLSAALSNVSLHENSNGRNIMEICGSLSRNLDQFVGDVSHLEENVSKHLASWQEQVNIVSNSVDTFFKSVGTGTDSEIAALGEKVALLHGACSSVLAEIESRKAELVGNDNFNMSLHQVEEDFSSMESVRSMVSRLSSAVKELVVANAETVERNEKEMKVIIANLQRELHEKDIQNDRMCNELVGQVKEAQAGAKIFAEDLQSASARMRDMQDQLGILVRERDSLKERVKELQEEQASHSELQENVTSLSNLLAAKDQEIEALMQALDEEESQMEDLKHRVTELEQEVQQKNLDLQKAEASRGKISKKLSITVDKFDELHQLSENLLAEIEKLQQQVQDRDTEVSFLRQEVTRCTNEALVASQKETKRDSEEIQVVLSWFDTMASLLGLEDSPSTDARSHLNLYMEPLEKRIASILSETEELRLVGQSKDSLLEAERSRVAELRQREATLEKILHDKESQPRSSTSEIVEVEPLINKRTTSGASIPSQVRSLRKGNNDQVAISIDADQPDQSLSLEDDDDKAHGFRSLTTSRIIPRFTRPVTNMIDGLWVSCDRTLMRQPALRLGIMIYWAILHALLASFVV
ncbi:trans-Golgi network-localized SYP41-interacting protein 1 isoform X2 [Raphanus sativus]|uniref:Trans-Golgi network-localized SYP41-interacting protein 1 isoform X2 n=1 Tax=Raphanus sativus TaxID=3726 RepID=A0A9W3D6I6_RAPSA|nr:trans-Golgi network-localized SYP41-interacting protein 1 isoform X2 [Raphanus sativus]